MNIYKVVLVSAGFFMMNGLSAISFTVDYTPSVQERREIDCLNGAKTKVEVEKCLADYADEIMGMRGE